MRRRTKHSLEVLKLRAKQALNSQRAIEIVEVHEYPNGAQKTANKTGLNDLEYPIWALAAIKRDHPDDYNNLPEIIQFRKFRTAPTGTAEI